MIKMNWKWHTFIASIVFFAIWIPFYDLKFPDLIALIIFTNFPDIDTHFEAHRHFLTHSIIFPMIWVLWYGSMIPIWFRALFMVSISIHLLLDLKTQKDKQKGFYCIYLSKKKRLNGKKSTLYLLSNGVIGIITALFIILI